MSGTESVVGRPGRDGGRWGLAWVIIGGVWAGCGWGGGWRSRARLRGNDWVVFASKAEENFRPEKHNPHGNYLSW